MPFTELLLCLVCGFLVLAGGANPIESIDSGLGFGQLRNPNNELLQFTSLGRTKVLAQTPNAKP